MIPSNRIEILKKQIERSRKYIRSSKIKAEIRDIFENDWILNSKDVENKNGFKFYSELNDLFEEFYSFSKKDYFTKSEILSVIRKLEEMIDIMHIEKLREGLEFKENFKEKILEELEKRQILEAIKYFKKAEENMKKDSEMSCDNSRKCIEEIFRFIRSKYEKKEIKRGTLSQHTSWLECYNYISNIEKQFFNSGEYSFLSEKGNHANKEKKEEADAIFGIRLILISIEYLINKGLL